MNHDVAMFLLGAFVVGFGLMLYRCTKVAERTADTAEAFEARRVAREAEAAKRAPEVKMDERQARMQELIRQHDAKVRAEMRQRLIDELDYTPVSREAEAWLKGVTR